jgi:hypothetical protein
MGVNRSPHHNKGETKWRFQNSSFMRAMDACRKRSIAIDRSYLSTEQISRFYKLP